MGLFSRTPDVVAPPPLKSVSQLVTEFTGKFQEVVDANLKIVETQAGIISAAQAKMDTAKAEEQMANKFIKNFNAMAGIET